MDCADDASAAASCGPGAFAWAMSTACAGESLADCIGYDALCNWIFAFVYTHHPSNKSYELPVIMYESLYDAYEKVIQKEADERNKRKIASLSTSMARVEEVQRKRKELESKRRRLSELPAFSSKRMIDEVEKEMHDQCAAEQQEVELQQSDNLQKSSNGFERMRQCRLALEALDVSGWKRSYHQRMFHDAYIAACARPFWKLDPPGAFARAHQKILDINNWDNLAQEILISTPRRFGNMIIVNNNPNPSMHS